MVQVGPEGGRPAFPNARCEADNAPVSRGAVPYPLPTGVFSAQNPLETLILGQTGDRNGFGTLKIGGSHVVSPWDQLF